MQISWIEPLFLWYFVSINAFYSLFLSLGAIAIFRRKKELAEEDFMPLLRSESMPDILFIVPMYNESTHAIPNLYNLLNLSYRHKQIIAVNDGSEDDTLPLLQKTFDLIPMPKYYSDALSTRPIRALYQSRSHPEIRVIDKEHGGKFDTLNAAINASKTTFFIALDADTFLDDAGFEALIRPMLTSPRTIAIGASVRLINGCTLHFQRITTAQFPQELLPAFQGLEYLRAFLLRQGLDCINGNFVISGAFAIFPRDLIIQIGGFCSSVAEDLEIIVRLHRIQREQGHAYKIQYLPDPVAWTTAPTSLSALGRQRTRWHRGLLEALWYHKRLFFNPRYGIFGLVSIPFGILAEAFEPFVELCAWLYVAITWFQGTLDVAFFVLLLLASFGYTFLYSLFALFLEECSFHKYPSLRSLCMLLLSNCLENFGYRQMTLFWRLRGWWHFMQRFASIRRDARQMQALIKIAKERNH